MSLNLLSLGVVTISYNQAHFLPEAIDSVRLRDLHRLKYVIVDPGSTDGSREIIRCCHDRFSAIILEPDAGPADGLNKGFARCDAEILGFLNADDRFTPGSLDYVLRYFGNHPDVDVMMGAGRVIDETGRVSRKRRILNWRFSSRNVLTRTYTLVQPSVFFRRRIWERVSGFNAINFVSWDLELFVDMDLAGAQFRMVPKVLSEFRIYPNSITGSKRLLGEKRENDERVDAKIRKAGIRESPNGVLRLKQMVFFFHPIRRVLEWIVR